MEEFKDLEYICIGIYDVYVNKENYEDVIKTPSSFIDVENIRLVKEFWIYFDDSLIDHADGINKAFEMIRFFEKYLQLGKYDIKIHATI